MEDGHGSLGSASIRGRPAGSELSIAPRSRGLQITVQGMRGADGLSISSICWRSLRDRQSIGIFRVSGAGLAYAGSRGCRAASHFNPWGATRHNRERIATGTDQLGLAVKSVSGIAVSAQEPGVPARFHAPIAPTNRCFCRQCSENAAPPSSFITRLKL